MFALHAALVAATQPAPVESIAGAGGTGWVFATIGHSEWCPPGHVTVDLRTGRYTLTPRASRRRCGEAGLERPVRTGRLGAGRLEAVRSAYRRAVAEGLDNPDCRQGPKRPIVISNGGTPILVLATGAATGSAPDDLSCWNEAAFALQDELDEAFESTHQR